MNQQNDDAALICRLMRAYDNQYADTAERIVRMYGYPNAKFSHRRHDNGDYVIDAIPKYNPKCKKMVTVSLAEVYYARRDACRAACKK